MKTPEALERQVSRIHDLLERSHDVVTWNDHMPDPDNATQLRQIDITVRRDDKLTIIECRLSRNRQNVKWIEELIGRGQSLGAQNIIAVASAGFTLGAQRKAARYGVLLRDLRQLSDEEITSWGGRTTLILYYYQYSNVNLAIGFASQSIRVSILQYSAGNFGRMMSCSPSSTPLQNSWARSSCLQGMIAGQFASAFSFDPRTFIYAASRFFRSVSKERLASLHNP